MNKEWKFYSNGVKWRIGRMVRTKILFWTWERTRWLRSTDIFGDYHIAEFSKKEIAEEALQKFISQTSEYEWKEK